MPPATLPDKILDQRLVSYKDNSTRHIDIGSMLLIAFLIGKSYRKPNNLYMDP